MTHINRIDGHSFHLDQDFALHRLPILAGADSEGSPLRIDEDSFVGHGSAMFGRAEGASGAWEMTGHRAKRCQDPSPTIGDCGIMIRRPSVVVTLDLHSIVIVYKAVRVNLSFSST